MISLEALAFAPALPEANGGQSQTTVKLPDCKEQELFYPAILEQATQGADLLDLSRSDRLKFLTENPLREAFSREVTWCPTRSQKFDDLTSLSYRIESFMIGNEPLRFSPEEVRHIRARLIREGLDIPAEADSSSGKSVLYIQPPYCNFNQSLKQTSKLCFGLSRYKFDEVARLSRGRKINNHGRVELPNYLYLSSFLNRDGYGEETPFPLEEDTLLDRIFLHTVVYSAVLDVMSRASGLSVYLKTSMGRRLDPSLVPLIAGHK